jgi:hypothetical protein
MSDAKDLRPPEVSRRDKAIAAAHALVKGAAGSVPIAGSFLSEIVELLYRKPIDQRRDEWLRDVASALEEIRSRAPGLTAEALAENPEFVTVLHRATETAVRTHEVSKRRQLRNALVSSAMPSAPQIDKQLFFLRLVEELTHNQVLVLAFYRDPKGWFVKRGRQPQEYLSAGRDAALKQAYPGLVESQYFRELVIADLERRGLMGGLSGMVSGGAVYDAITKPLAIEFLDYVAANDDSDPATA